MNIERYNEALKRFVQPGHRYEMIPELTRIGKAIGLTADDIIEHAHEAGVTNRDANIRAMWKGAKVQSNGTYHCRRKSIVTAPKLKTYPTYVKNLIRSATDSTAEALMRLSPISVTGMTGRESATAQIKAMFAPDDLIVIGTMQRGFGQRNLRPVKKWLQDPDMLRYEQVKINPFTGKEEEGGAHGRTRFGSRCISRHTFTLLEFDHLSLDAQYAFWCEMVKREGHPVTAIVHSGNRSLHGLIRVNARDREQWEILRDRMIAYFCTAGESDYQADRQALSNPTCAIRLAGVQRHGGTKQTLLYLNPMQSH